MKVKSILNIIRVCLALLLFLAVQGCRKFVEVPPPPTQLSSGSVFADDASAAAAVTSIYTNMSAKGITDGPTCLSLLMGGYADEYVNYSSYGAWAPYCKDAPEGNSPGFLEMYQRIYQVNTALSGLNASNTLTPVIKSQLIGEVSFMRAFFYFYLVNLYGDVPLMLTGDPSINSKIGRTNKNKVYDQIIKDLTVAKNSLQDEYRTGGGVASVERIRPNKSTAIALLARVYLYKSDWNNAEVASTSVISNTSLYSLVTLNAVFKKNSNESIFQIQAVNVPNTSNLITQYLIIRPNYTPTNNAALMLISPQLQNALQTNGGQRFTSWVGQYTANATTYYYANKYQSVLTVQPNTEYMTVLRLSEQYLIRAEARFQQGNVDGAKSDLMAIRQRAGLGPVTTTDILDAIHKERQVELFGEWGDRWFDLKRSGQVNSVMSAVAVSKGVTWADYKTLFPIPQTEIDLNPALLPNNSGY
ncbi:RagB/SusD family nutrient uptake outer membrane protein [Mucilaginibacter corticis]|uniref:RagB/SusD family nutrient uptake outer membrane protein n=1 Tax=Mucilaginibacter corticis TaxID=2597670 RepID=A0A556M9L9_9SPHI|nr:RagB/SusD family nutrient uptake outer membrane protein [Mucilaginibacter corticis]TSJ36578.1 RagB/SusD family nutrient uptake outer membrane protein [Mucilaginibacter corticis]